MTLRTPNKVISVIFCIKFLRNIAFFRELKILEIFQFC